MQILWNWAFQLDAEVLEYDSYILQKELNKTTWIL